MARTNSTLSEKVYTEIYEDIVNQRLICGQKLTLKGLSERYQASYTPIREALSRLSECGLVSYYSNWGVKVIDFSDSDIQDIFRFVGELDAMAIKLSERALVQKAMIFELQDIVEKGNRTLQQGDLLEWKEYSQDFHKIFYQYAQSKCLSEASERLRPKVELLSIMYYKDIDLAVINDGHNAIFEKVEKRDYDTAAELMRTHLQYDMVYAVKAFRKYKEMISEGI